MKSTRIFAVLGTGAYEDGGGWAGEEEDFRIVEKGPNDASLVALYREVFERWKEVEGFHRDGSGVVVR